MKIVLKRTALLSLIGVITIIFGFSSTRVDSQLKAIHISWVFQMLHDNELVPIRHSIDVFYSKEYLIARLRSNNFTIDTKLKPGTNQVLEETRTIDSSYIYLISKKGERFGLAFDSLSIKTDKHIKLDLKTGSPLKINVDSCIRTTLTIPAFFYKLRSKGKDSVSIEKDVINGLLVEKYIYKRREIQEPDSLYFYFRKQQMEFSFIVKDRRDDNMYLFKARAICNASPKGRFPNVNVDVKKYEHKFEITEIEVPEAELKKVIELYRSSISNEK